MHSIFQLLDPALKSRLLLLQRITDSVRSCLPTEIANHCWAANINGQTLIIGIDSSIFSIPVRYRQQDILERLKNDSNCEVYLNRIRIKVSSISDGHRNPTEPLKLSTDSAKQLRSAAAGIEDEGVRDALLHLANRG